MKNSLSSYLRVYKPLPDAQVLIIEGWIFNNTLVEVRDEFRSGNYQYILISGESGNVVSRDGYQFVKTRISERIIPQLVKLGVDSINIKVVEIHNVNNHHTLSMALAAKEWLIKNDPAITRVNVCTSSSHGRKTWIAFRRAFENACSVGVLSLPQKNNSTPLWKNSGRRYRSFLRRLVNVVYAATWPLSMVHYEIK